MKTTRSYLLFSLAFAVSALLLAYIFRHPLVRQKPPPHLGKVTLAYSATMDSVLMQVAQTQGYYLQEGLEAIVRLHPYGKLALKDVLDGKADFATVGETPFMFAVMKGEKVSIIATIQTSGKNHAIIARKDKGILRPRDLKGKRIAVTVGTTADFFMDTFLAVHEIARTDVNVLNLKPMEMARALAEGDVDAVSVFMPFSIQVEKALGDRGVVFIDENIYTFMFNVVATQDFIRENPEKVRKLLRALIRAEEFISLNKVGAQKIVVDIGRLDAALVRDVWPAYDYNVKLEQSLLLALEEETRWAIDGGLIGRKDTPNYLDNIYLEGLESVKPKAVRILR